MERLCGEQEQHIFEHIENFTLQTNNALSATSLSAPASVAVPSVAAASAPTSSVGAEEEIAEGMTELFQRQRDIISTVLCDDVSSSSSSVASGSSRRSGASSLCRSNKPLIRWFLLPSTST